MKTLPLFKLSLFSVLFLFLTIPTSQAAHATSSHVLINLVITPKKAKKKKSNWKERIGLTLLKKRIQKRIDKLQAKAKKRAVIQQTKKDKKLKTHPLAIVSPSMILFGILMTSFLAPIAPAAAFAVAILAGLGAIITGILSLVKIKRQPEQYTGKPLAILGIILGIFCLLFITGLLLLIAYLPV